MQPRLRRLTMIGAVLAIAAGSGHLTQSGFALPWQDAGPVAITPLAAMDAPQTPAAPRAAVLGPFPAPPLAAAAANAPPAVPAPLAAPAVSAPPPPMPDPAPLRVASVGPLTEIGAPPPAAAPDCAPRLDLTARPGAMLDVTLFAPCRGGERVVLRHGGLAVTGVVSGSGSLIAEMPAFSHPAALSVLFSGGERVANVTAIPEIMDIERFAIQWMGDDAFQLHAYENGAEYGGDGHVSAARPRNPSSGGGFLTLAGDDQTERPMLAEVYTFPRAASGAGPGPGAAAELTVEAAVTETTCGREMLAETIRSTGGAVTVRDLSVTMPGCDAVGEFLVLQNLSSDMKLAAN